MDSLRAWAHRLRLDLKYAFWRHQGVVNVAHPRFPLRLDVTGMGDVGQVLSLRRDLERNQREPHLLEACLTHIGPREVVVEVGAWIGHYTVLLAKYIAPQGRVFCFEPDPAAVRQAWRNLALNGVANAWILPMALSDRNDWVSLYTNNRFGNSGSTLMATNPGVGERIEAPGATLDQMVQLLNIQPDAIKIDVEGAEGLVLAGAMQTIAQPGVKVLVEVHGSYLRQAGLSDTALFRQLAEAGKELTFLNRDDDAPYRPGARMDPNRSVPLDNYHILAR